MFCLPIPLSHVSCLSLYTVCAVLPHSVSQLAVLRERLGQAEVERDRLQAELEELRAGQCVGLFSDSEDSEGMLDFPGVSER